MSDSASYPVDDYVMDVSQKILDALTSTGAKALSVSLERVDYLRWRGLIKVTVGYRE